MHTIYSNPLYATQEVYSISIGWKIMCIFKKFPTIWDPIHTHFHWTYLNVRFKHFFYIYLEIDDNHLNHKFLKLLLLDVIYLRWNSLNILILSIWFNYFKLQKESCLVLGCVCVVMWRDFVLPKEGDKVLIAFNSPQIEVLEGLQKLIIVHRLACIWVPSVTMWQLWCVVNRSCNRAHASK